mgnify:CR=1 FL=1
MKNKLILLMLMIVVSTSSQARIAAYEFESAAQETTYKELTHELRCLVCQNQNIADSNAELAQDLKRKTYELVVEGKTKQQITDYMIERYGDFVMYRPPISNTTLLLWAGPFIIFLIGLIVLFKVIRSRHHETDEQLSNEQKNRAEQLLKGE